MVLRKRLSKDVRKLNIIWVCVTNMVKAFLKITLKRFIGIKSQLTKEIRSP